MRAACITSHWHPTGPWTTPRPTSSPPASLSRHSPRYGACRYSSTAVQHYCTPYCEARCLSCCRASHLPGAAHPWVPGAWARGHAAAAARTRTACAQGPFCSRPDGMGGRITLFNGQLKHRDSAGARSLHLFAVWCWCLGCIGRLPVHRVHAGWAPRGGCCASRIPSCGWLQTARVLWH